LTAVLAAAYADTADQTNIGSGGCTAIGFCEHMK